MAKLKMFEVDRENEYKKCGCCNWEVSKVYLMAITQEEADRLFNESEIEDGEPRGLCGDCMCALLAETGYTIETESAWSHRKKEQPQN
jgi:hypothetical protein